MELLSNLNFNLEKSLPKHAITWCHKRAIFHRSFESMMDQFIVFLYYFTKLRDKTKVGILLPDIYPETSECFAENLIARIDRLGWNITIETLLRRKPRFTSFQNYIDWSDPLTMSKFDVVLVACSNSQFPIVHQILAEQKDYGHTIFYCVSTGLAKPRLEKLLHTHQVIVPLVDVEPRQGDLNCTNIHFKPSKIERQSMLPDLDVMKKVSVQYLFVKGMTMEESQRYF